MKASAIIVAAGGGNRLGHGQPKAFVTLCGRPMLYYSLAAVAKVPLIGEAVITVPPAMESRAQRVAADAGLGCPVKVTVGGTERQDSVRVALALTSAESELVIVHDAARPLVEPALFEACLASAARFGGAIAAIAVADTLKRAADATITATVERSGLYQAQTPQAFRRDLLVAAHERAVRERINATDDADLVERAGGRVMLVEGSALNLKITTGTDLEIAEAILCRRQSGARSGV
jgi:2-C-methyl-D-erythritol 4-phosphate cytidylyltransferase